LYRFWWLSTGAVGACGLFLAIGRANAQPATDNDLYAAYCSGALGSMIETVKSIPRVELDKMPLSDEQKKALRKSLGDVERSFQDLVQRKTRFDTYLQARGYFTSKADAFGVLLAVKRGQQDHAECKMDLTDCGNKCTGPISDAIRCQLKCPETSSRACRSTARCTNDDALPF
jgi:hypothetical protein